MDENTPLQDENNIVKSLSEDDRRAIANQTRELWHDWTQQIQPLLNESSEGWQLYAENVPKSGYVSSNFKDVKTKKEQGRKGIRLGFVARSVDSIHSVQHNTTFPTDERFFDGKPANDMAKENQDLYETWKAENLGLIDFNGAMNDHRKNSIIDGTACAHTPWKSRKKRHVTYEPVKLFGVLPVPFLPPTKKVDDNYVCWEGTDCEPLAMVDWRADPNSPKFDENCGFIRRWYEPTWQIKETYKLKEVKPYHECQDDWDKDTQRKEAMGINHWSIGKGEVEGKDNALLKIRYDNFVVNGKVYKNHVALVLNDTDTIYFGPNDYDHGDKPYILTPYKKIPGCVYGKSAIRDIIPIAHACDTTVTQFVDILSWAAGPILQKNVKDPLIAALGNLELRPGMQVPTTIPDAIRQVAINIGSAEALPVMTDRLESYIREATGATQMFTGADPSGGEQPTAFQVGASMEGSNNRFQETMTIFNNTALDRFMKMAWENDRQFMTKTYDVSLS